MRQRLLILGKNHSILLFGARGSGKSTLIEAVYKIEASEDTYINLLDTETENRFAVNPMELVAVVEGMTAQEKYVVIDEIQKVPKLLDVVHLLIESKKCGKHFILTGSSARKLKSAGVNLLAGRAFVYHLFPFSYLELKTQFQLNHALKFGMLPAIYKLKTSDEKQKFLQSYTLTYLKEEIWAEHLIKNLDPFRRFLEVAAQMNGKIINYSKISRDVNVDDKTVKSYFSLLEDTLLGFLIEPYHHSFRKRLKTAPKFYFVDVGIARALARMQGTIPTEGTSYYGDLFESFIVVECLKLASYFQSEYKFSYLMTGAGAEIDLVVDRPGKPLLLVEIKSTTQVREMELQTLQKMADELGECEAVCFSRDPRKKKMGLVTVYPWEKGLAEFFS